MLEELARVARLVLDVEQRLQPHRAQALRVLRVLPPAPLALYIQCAAMPFSATACIGSVRIWNSTAVPSGLTSVVCSDW